MKEFKKLYDMPKINIPREDMYLKKYYFAP